MDHLPPNHPDRPEEDISGYKALPPVEAEDEPVPEEVLRPPVKTSGLKLPDLILGCATFGYGIYSTPTQVLSELPLRVVRLALSSGITAFDTAPHYHPSEIILGHCLSALKEQRPREEYQLITKVGKYGPGREGHMFDPESVGKCVERSLRRLKTDYLDVVYLHDIEFKSTIPCPAGNHLEALSSHATAEKYGLASHQLKSLGEGDDEILAGFNELRTLQQEGKIRYVGLAGYPLPTLLRFAKIILELTGKGVDVVQTYAHETLANQILSEGFLDAFEDAQVGLVTNASPLAMGLLTRSGGPEWHPARDTPLFDAVKEAVELCEKEGVKIEDVATDYGYQEVKGKNGRLPNVVGCKNLQEVHANLKSFRRAKEGGKERQVGEKVVKLMQERGVRNWSWQSGVDK